MKCGLFSWRWGSTPPGDVQTGPDPHPVKARSGKVERTDRQEPVF